MNFVGGAASDPPSHEGLACLTNRMLLRGTVRRTRAEFENTIEHLGVNLIPSCGVGSLSIGGSLLGRHTNTWFELVEEALCQPRFESEEVERAKRELISEQRLLLDDDAQIGRLVLKEHLFAGSRYAHSALGTQASVERIQAEHIRAYAAQAYTQSRLLMSCSGDIESANFQQHLSKITNSLPVGEEWQLPLPPDEIKRKKVIILDKPSRSQCQVFTGQRTLGADDGSLLPLQVGALILGGTFSSRMVQELRVEKGLCYGAYAWVGAERQCGGFFTHADVSAEKVDEAVVSLNALIDEFMAKGPTEPEFTFAQSAILKGMPFGLETAAMEAAQRTRLRLLGRDSSELDRKEASVKALTQADVQLSLNRLSKIGERVMVIVCSYTEPIARKLAPLIEDADVVYLDWN